MTIANYVRTNTTIDTVLCKMSRKYRDAREAERRDEERRREREERIKWEASVENARQENFTKMTSIMKEMPEKASLLWIKFQGGTTGTGNQFREIVNEQKEYIQKHDAPWCYTRGTGLLCVDPSKFKSPADIAKILWEPSRFLEGSTIRDWWFEEK